MKQTAEPFRPSVIETVFGSSEIRKEELARDLIVVHITRSSARAGFCVSVRESQPGGP